MFHDSLPGIAGLLIIGLDELVTVSAVTIPILRTFKVYSPFAQFFFSSADSWGIQGKIGQILLMFNYFLRSKIFVAPKINRMLRCELR